VIARAKARGLKLMTVGRRARRSELVSRASTPLGQQLVLRHAGKEHKLSLPLIGAYQAEQCADAAGLVLATGGEWETTCSGMGRVAPVRGRLERAVISRAGAPVYVDYAHTPDAVEAAIAALRPHVEGRLITVLGAGGDRDEGKRAGMGAVAARLSDVVIVTDDNPRSEDPAAIRRAVLEGAPGAIEIGDRREAIARRWRWPRRRHRADRGQGPRTGPDRRRPGAAVRRRDRGAGVRGVTTFGPRPKSKPRPAGDAPRAPFEVTGVTFDSREVGMGDCSWRCRGRSPTATSSSPRRLRRERRARWSASPSTARTSSSTTLPRR
jgi:hypothetical protein